MINLIFSWIFEQQFNSKTNQICVSFFFFFLTVYYSIGGHDTRQTLSLPGVRHSRNAQKWTRVNWSTRVSERKTQSVNWNANSYPVNWRRRKMWSSQKPQQQRRTIHGGNMPETVTRLADPSTDYSWWQYARNRDKTGGSVFSERSIKSDWTATTRSHDKTSGF